MENRYSLPQLADDLVLRTRNLLHEFKTEEDLKIGFEKLIEPIRIELGLKFIPKYEKVVYRGRSDALHGQMIIEYESPRAFLSKKNIDHAFEQLVKYLTAELKETKMTQMVGVGFDGEKIFFVKNWQGKWIKEPITGAYEFTQRSAKTFLIHLRALSKIMLTAENLEQKFGPHSTIGQKAVRAFVNALENWGDRKGINRPKEVFFQEWKRLFGIVYGEQFFSGYQKMEVQSFSKLYGVKVGTSFQELLFCIHTYFAFLMKIIAAEILVLGEISITKSFSSYLNHSSDNDLKEQLKDMEDGGTFARRGITNFLEGDFFRWYLDTFDSPELKEAIREIALCFSEFEPATSTLNLCSARDLLKRLYQYLVPKEIRHCLGEYYTPDWLAELLLNEIGYNGNTSKRCLDPACGSGTFLVMAIQRAIKYGREKEKIPDSEIIKRIVSNIWGFDLNPLAVIASRTNYLFALGEIATEILDKCRKIEIPIYLADSVLWPQRNGQMMLRPRGDSVEIRTSIKTFFVPSIWVTGNGFLFQKAVPLIEEMVRNRYSIDEAMPRFQDSGLVFSPHEEVVQSFYQEILELEKQNKNAIWARFLKNAFAPMIAGKFDFVFGNPPWIRWDYLSQDYRDATFQLWKDYGLFSLKGFQTRLGGGKKDFSMLFVYTSADYYLKKGAKLGFLITQEVFKSKGAGEGFRRFQFNENNYLKVLRADDLVSVHPFEGAANKTAMIVLTKGKKTEYPLPYFVWRKTKGIGKIPPDKSLMEVLPILQKEKCLAKPIGSNTGPWQTYSTGSDYLSKIHGNNYYKAHSGAYLSPYGVFWLKVLKVLSDGNLLVENLPEKGKTNINKIEEVIEQELVYPCLRGSDIQRWKSVSKIYVLLPQDPAKQEPYSQHQMRQQWPRTYEYLTKFRDILLSRASKPIRELMEKSTFYAVFGVSEYTIRKYKVVWKQMSNDIVGCVISTVKTPFGYKTIIPLHTVGLIATNSVSEAHYLCAIINSNPVRNFIKSFSSAGRGFGTPSVMEHLGIPQYDPDNILHQKIVENSQNCHRLKEEGKEEYIKKLEQINNKLIQKLFGI